METTWSGSLREGLLWLATARYEEGPLFEDAVNPVNQDLFSTPASPPPPAPSPPSREGHAEFALEQLKINPDLTFADLRLRGTLAGLSLHYATYARARKILDLPPLGRPRGRRAKKEGAADQAITPAASMLAEAATRARAAHVQADGNGFAPAMEELRAIYGERDRFRELLMRMREIVEAALRGA